MAVVHGVGHLHRYTGTLHWCVVVIPTVECTTLTFYYGLETFLYGFIVPVVPYMFETRLKQNPAYTQRYASGLLFVMGLMSTICAPIVGHFADKLPGRKAPLLISLPGCTLGSVLIASTISGTSH